MAKVFNYFSSDTAKFHLGAFWTKSSQLNQNVFIDFPDLVL